MASEPFRKPEKAAWAADNEDGLHAYVVDEYSWGKTLRRIQFAPSLAAAKRQFGWTRMKYTSISVRRATVEDQPGWLK